MSFSKRREGGKSANASGSTVVFTGRMPSNLKQGLRVVSAKSGKSQQDIVAIAITEWCAKNGYGDEIA